MAGRIRSIKPEWLEDELLLRAPLTARVLSVALLLLADDYGRGRAHRTSLAARVFPPSEDSSTSLVRSAEQLQEGLSYLAGVRFVSLYEVEGQSYFAIRNWTKHQRVHHPGKPLVPPPPESLPRLSRMSPESLPRVSRGSPETLPNVSRESPESLPPEKDRDKDQEKEKDRDRDTRDRETPCPLTLHETFSGYAQMSKALNVPEQVLRAGAAEFVSYWTVGGGAGQRRPHWAAKLREHLRQGVAQGKSWSKPANPHEPPPVTPEQLRAARDRARAENRARLEAVPLDGAEVVGGSENASTGQPGGSNGIGEAALRELGI
jgi:hypothetical protein